MTDTPETDLEDDLYVECASSYIIKESTGEIFTGDFVPAEFARRLERERDQLKSINAELLEALKVSLRYARVVDQEKIRAAIAKAIEAKS